VAITRLQGALIAAVALAIPASAIGAIYPANTWLQVGPVAVILPFAVWWLRRNPLSDASAICIAGFVLLHLFAARWSYSFVPYEAWLAAAGLGSVDRAFGFERNMFDRLAHFVFGALSVLPVAEVAMRQGGIGRRMALVVAVLAVLAAGSLYEVFEWTLTLALAPEDAGAYNGEQGDIFDAQKDMAIAALGATLSLWPTARLLERLGHKPTTG
jgi:putative membrane protein